MIMKNKIFRLLALTIIALLVSVVEPSAFAQTPQKFNYQAVCRNNLGNIIAGQSVTLRLTVHDLLPGGAVLYKETHIASTNNFGLVMLAVGGGTVDTGSFSSIPWGTGDKYLEVELNTGTGFNNIGTTQLLSVPYALYAEKANVPGVPGPTGLQGVTGPQGTTGSDGATGAPGPVAGSNKNIIFNDNGAAAGSNNLVFDKLNTRVGIGTATPSASLDVENTGGIVAMFVGDAAMASSNTYVGIRDIGGGVDWYLEALENGWFAINQSGGYNRFIIDDATGNIGIGTGPSSDRLNVSGNIHASGTITSGNNITIDGTVNPGMITGGSGQVTFSSSEIITMASIGIGTNAPAQRLDVVGGSIRTDHQLISTAPFGMAPISVTSSDVCLNLNADMLDGNHFTDFASSSHSHDHNTLTNVQMAGTSVTYGHISSGPQTIDGPKTFLYSPSAVNYVSTASTGLMPLLVTSTTTCTNLNADMVDGLHASSTATAGMLYPLDINAKIPNARLYAGTGNSLDADMTDGYHAGNASGNVPVSNGTVNTNLNSDMVDGVHHGKVYLTVAGTIATTRGNTCILTWDGAGNIQLTNNSGDWCDVWWISAKGAVLACGNNATGSGTSNVSIISGVNVANDYGFEVHFGQADGAGGWCSVWLQYANGVLVGHYINNTSN
jgi:hypothetical protein